MNPHFLFNSLTSLSLLIGEDRARAEEFVNHLARVYRYLLQGSSGRPDLPASAAPRQLVSLQTESAFLGSYAALLHARYGESLRIVVNVPAAWESFYLPHLSLQGVLDHAIQHNVVRPQQPLVVTISPGPEEHLRVEYTHQPKSIRLEMQQAGLEQLRATYELLGAPLRLEYTEREVAVLLPLLTAAPRSETLL